jgi:hypothetical protein
MREIRHSVVCILLLTVATAAGVAAQNGASEVCDTEDLGVPSPPCDQRPETPAPDAEPADQARAAFGEASDRLPFVVWTNWNDGEGSGLDADTVDGVQADAFARADHDHDARYYTQSEADERFLAADEPVDADTLDGHDGDDFWTKSEGSVVDASETAHGAENVRNVERKFSTVWTTMPGAEHAFDTDGGLVQVEFTSTVCGVKDEDGTSWGMFRLRVDGDTVDKTGIHVDSNSRWNHGHTVQMTRILEIPAGDHTAVVEWKLDSTAERIQCNYGFADKFGAQTLTTVELKN